MNAIWWHCQHNFAIFFEQINCFHRQITFTIVYNVKRWILIWACVVFNKEINDMKEELKIWPTPSWFYPESTIRKMWCMLFEMYSTKNDHLKNAQTKSIYKETRRYNNVLFCNGCFADFLLSFSCENFLRCLTCYSASIN